MAEKIISTNNLLVDLAWQATRLGIMLVIAFTFGCFSLDEKVHKPLGRVATYHEGHFEVESFLIDGEPPDQEITRMPCAEVSITITFTRKIDIPNYYSTTVNVVSESKELATMSAGTHTVFYQDFIPSRRGKVKQTIKTRISLPDPESALSIEKHGLGRYCIILVSEANSELVSQKIWLAKD